MIARWVQALIVLSGILAAGPGAAQAMPHRIVSLNLCADQYLIALADRDQVAALTQNARDPELSFFAKRAAAYPATAGDAEAVLALKPDLILGYPLERAMTRALLAQFHYRIVDVPAANSFAEIVDQTRIIAQAIGRPKRGAALIAAMQAALAKIPPPAPGHRPVAVHYQRRGFVTGTETLFNEIIRRAGLDNLAARFEDRALAHVPLERIVAANPDYLIFTTHVTHAQDRGTELLLHPALRRQFGAGRILELTEAQTICGGPSFPAAVAILYHQLHPGTDRR